MKLLTLYLKKKSGLMKVTPPSVIPNIFWGKFDSERKDIFVKNQNTVYKDL